MLRTAATILALASASLAVSAPPTAPYSKVLSFGDSWTYLGEAQLGKVLDRWGVKLSTEGIPGAPAEFWSLVAPNKLKKEVARTGAQAVVLSVGGDDFLEGLPLGLDKDKLLAEMLNSTAIILDALFAAHPDVHVYQWGYEILDWKASEFCEGFGDSELKSCCCPRGWKDATCMNTYARDYLQIKYVGALAERYAAQNYHGLNLLGTLQAAGGVPGASVGQPVLSEYSPPGSVINASGDPWACVHLTATGFHTMYVELAKQMGFQ